MSTAKKPTTTKSGATKAGAKATAAAPDAIQMLSAEHQEVKALFKEYDQLVQNEGDAADKQALAARICTKLTVHAAVEEEVFYPAAREVLGEDEDLIDEAEVEHATVNDLIAQIEDASPQQELYDAKVKVLGEYVDHHVKEEEGEIFPKARKGGFDAAALGAEISARKQELLADWGADQTIGATA